MMNNSKTFQVIVSYPRDDDGYQPSDTYLPLMDGKELAYYLREIMMETRSSQIQDNRVVRVWGIEDNTYIMSFICENGQWRFDARNLFPANFF